MTRLAYLQGIKKGLVQTSRSLKPTRTVTRMYPEMDTGTTAKSTKSTSSGNHANRLAITIPSDNQLKVYNEYNKPVYD